MRQPKPWYRERLDAAAANVRPDRTSGAFALGADAIDFVLRLAQSNARFENQQQIDELMALVDRINGVTS